MKLARSAKLAQKGKLNQTLRSWLPILQASSDELKDEVAKALQNNPFASVEQKRGEWVKSLFKGSSISSDADNSVATDSLYEKLISQINAPLFATNRAQQIAMAIIECVSDEGYFEYDERILGGFDLAEVERVRKRFGYLEPVGVGAKDYKESFIFQLNEMCDDDEIYELASTIIKDFENLAKYTKIRGYEAAIKLIKKFKNPPAIEYMQSSMSVMPDIFVFNSSDGIEVRVSDEYYPQIHIDTDGIDDKSEFVASRIKEAKALIDALEMRKATLYKIGLMIIEYQYDYFNGGDIKPMKLKDIAEDLGRNPSTISRAIQNKYLACERGIVALKEFFASAANSVATTSNNPPRKSEEVSNAAIKEFVRLLIRDENRIKPFSDEAIMYKIKSEFGVKIVRRTITKYRKSLNIASSSERKRLYQINA